MKMFKNKDPRIDFLELVKEANPEHADLLTIDSFNLRTPETFRPTEEKPFNSRILISDSGLMKVIGSRYIYFNRVKLSYIYANEDAKIIKQTGADNRIRYAELEDALFAVLGTRINFDGEFADGGAVSGWDAFVPGIPKTTGYRTSATSLRYYPADTITVRVESAGVGLSVSVTVRNVEPYVHESGVLRINPSLPVSSNSNPYNINTKAMSMGVLGWSADFSSILSGTSNQDILEVNPDDTNGAYPYRFKESFFEKLNLLFEYYGYPMLDKRGFKNETISALGNVKEWCMNPDLVSKASNVRYLNFDHLESSVFRDANLVGETAYNGNSIPLPYT